MTTESIEKLARALAETLPESLRSARADLEQNFRGVLQAGLSRLDLVTREEFEVQQAVLARTRDKLEAFEARLAELDKAGHQKTTRKNSGKKKASNKKVTRKKSAKKKVSKKKATRKKAAKKKPA